MFGGIKRFVDWNKLGIKLSRAQDAIEKFDKERPMDGKEKLLNAAKHVGLSAGAIALVAVGTYLTDPNVGQIISKDTTPVIAAVLVPLLHGLGAWIVKHLTTPTN